MTERKTTSNVSFYVFMALLVIILMSPVIWGILKTVAVLKFIFS